LIQALLISSPVPHEAPTLRHQGCAGHRVCIGALQMFQIGWSRIAFRRHSDEETVQRGTQREHLVQRLICRRFVRGGTRDQPRRGGVVDETGMSAPADEIRIRSQEILRGVTGSVFDRVDVIEAQRSSEQAQIFDSHSF
jgi:hypothetical protein